MKIQFPTSKIQQSHIHLETELSHNLTVVHITDLHLGFHTKLNVLHNLVLYINDLKPDIVCFTGDCFDNISKLSFDPYLVIPLFKTIQTKYGKFFSPGNHDYGANGIHQVISIMEQSDFHVLINSHHTLKTEAGKIAIFGIDDICFGRPNFSSTFQLDHKKYDFKLCLMHEPDKAKLLNPAINLILSGHTHGGQIRIPKIGALYTPTFGKIYKQGLYQIRHFQWLYVNRGIGMTRLPIRLFCPPEITIFHLNKEKSSKNS